MKKVALITGASTGIGKAMALIHAQKGGDLVVVARSVDKLKSLKDDLETRFSCEVKIISKDLTQPHAALDVYEEVRQNEIEVEYLINNAGFGGHGKFHERDWSLDQAMIQLNVTALTELTRLFLPDFVARDRGKILNVSSTASLVAGPLQAVYFATKAFVTSFSNAIAEELYNTNVTVTALLPGATETEFAKAAKLEGTDLFKDAFSAQEVAQAGYEGMLTGKLNVLAGLTLMQRFMIALAPLMPKKMMLKQMRKMQEIK